MAGIHGGTKGGGDVTLPKTDKEFQTLLTDALKTVCPVVREGVYTGDDVPCYITFMYYRRGVLFANGRPSASVWRCFVTLWVKKGVDAHHMREAMPGVITSIGGTYPTEDIDTDGEWKAYVYEFQFGGGV
jgi:hypothetical protein